MFYSKTSTINSDVGIRSVDAVVAAAADAALPHNLLFFSPLGLRYSPLRFTRAAPTFTLEINERSNANIHFKFAFVRARMPPLQLGSALRPDPLPLRSGLKCSRRVRTAVSTCDATAMRNNK